MFTLATTLLFRIFWNFSGSMLLALVWLVVCGSCLDGGGRSSLPRRWSFGWCFDVSSG
ncbi:MAG: hypothetical protein F6K36_29110 [Symploca sp. SIO3C6]|nr:hypothetical protein [Symploca sp. SIO3C6]